MGFVCPVLVKFCSFYSFLRWKLRSAPIVYRLINALFIYIYYEPPSSGDAYCDRQITLILSFELKFIVCRHVSTWGFRNRVCLSVPREEKKAHPSFVNISPTVVNDTSMERSSRVPTTIWKHKINFRDVPIPKFEPIPVLIPILNFKAKPIPILNRYRYLDFLYLNLFSKFFFMKMIKEIAV